MIEAFSPIARFLMWPNDGGTVEGYYVLFQWNRRELRRASSHSKLVIKERLAGQSPEDAVTKNEVRFEIIVEHRSFFVLPVSVLRDVVANHVWQVTALDKVGDDFETVAVSEIRTFRLQIGHPDFSRLRFAVGPGQESSTSPVTPPSNGNGRPINGSPCPNANFGPNGAFNTASWQAYNGSWLGQSSFSLSAIGAASGFSSGYETVTKGSGFDPQTSAFPVVDPGQTYSAQIGTWKNALGTSEPDGKVSILAYTFTVNGSNAHFTFAYAVVLQNPNHLPSEQPFFQFYIVKGTLISSTPIGAPGSSELIVADPNNPFFNKVQLNGIDTLYKGWTPVCIDLSNYIGQQLTIVFIAADCSPGGHYGYAYIGGLCQPNGAIASFTMPNQICGNETLWADGSASTNDISCYWQIEESDANGDTNPSTAVSEWFVGQQAGLINLTAWYASQGGTFKCNSYYLVTLAVQNACTPFNYQTQLVYVECPPVTAGPDLCVSCALSGQSVQLGVGNSTAPGLVYSWSPAAGLSNPLVASPYFEGSATYPITYTVTVTDANGCSNTAQTTLYCEPPRLSLQMIPDCCGATLIASASSFNSISWSTGQTATASMPQEKFLIYVTAAGTYSATATNPCGSVTASIDVPAYDVPSGPFPTIFAAPGFSPDGAGGLPTELYFLDMTPGFVKGTLNAYNATDFQLLLWDRWGNNFKTITGSSCDGFTNGTICWDGTDSSGNPVQEDVYTYQLRLKNCTYTNWTTISVETTKPYCTEWLFGIVDFWCLNWAEGNVFETEGSVAVVY